MSGTLVCLRIETLTYTYIRVSYRIFCGANYPHASAYYTTNSYSLEKFLDQSLAGQVSLSPITCMLWILCTCTHVIARLFSAFQCCTSLGTRLTHRQTLLFICTLNFVLQQVLWKLDLSYSYYLPIQDEAPSQSVKCVLKRNSRRSQVCVACMCMCMHMCG